MVRDEKVSLRRMFMTEYLIVSIVKKERDKRSDLSKKS